MVYRSGDQSGTAPRGRELTNGIWREPGMDDDFYCNEVLSGSTAVEVIRETSQVLAFRHTQPTYPIHIVVIPKFHVASLLDTDGRDSLLMELMAVVRDVASEVIAERGACRVITNLGQHQDSKHLHWHVVSGDRRA